MGVCPSICGTIDLIGNPQSGCETSIRRKTISRFAFFSCTTDLPEPITNNNIKPLFDDGSIVASSPLANITLSDPQYEDVVVDDCTTPQRVIVSREITFQDRYSVVDNSGSPTTYDNYHDYDFWADKLQHQQKLNYMVIYCDGDVKVARDEDGNLLTASITAYLNQDGGTNGGKKVEFKQVSINFNGDPLALTNKPEFNLELAGIEL